MEPARRRCAITTLTLATVATVTPHCRSNGRCSGGGSSGVGVDAGPGVGADEFVLPVLGGGTELVVELTDELGRLVN
jgi:hypothetical protein